jgi:hypothetical protein
MILGLELVKIGISNLFYEDSDSDYYLYFIKYHSFF